MMGELNEFDRRNTLAWLAEKHPGAVIELIGAVDIAWSGWECDTAAVLYTADRVVGIQIVNQVMAVDEPPATVLAERITAYRQLADDTEALLVRYRSMGGAL